MFGINEIDVGTLTGWKENGQSFHLLDVRSIEEVSHGIIPGGKSMPLHLLPVNADELCKQTDIVLYCRSGARSAQAVAYLQQRGFDKVFNLRGGIMDWVRQGQSIATA